MNLLPYEQGYLDGLCGIYSVINATRLIVTGMREEDAMKLFGKCMIHVEGRKSLGKVSTDGVLMSDIWSILKKVVLIKYAIVAERPFQKTREISLDDYFNTLREHFSKGGRRAAIISFECDDWDHWTVVKSISMKRLMLFDSSMMKSINIAKCTVNHPTKRNPYLIIPRETFFIYEK